jgi:hypothetical protein
MLGQPGLRAKLGIKVGKWVKNDAFAKLKDKSQNETKHKQEGFQDKWKGVGQEKAL